MSAPRIAGLIAALTVVTAACGAAPTAQTQTTTGGVNAATATSAADFGGLDKLVEAAKKEGSLHVIALPPDWANYGEIIKKFEEKYGLKVESENPDASSADEINAVKTRKGQNRAPDVLDVGQAFGFSGAKEGLYAAYKVQSWDKIPGGQKDPNGLWVNDYGGYVSIGCDAKKIGTCPKTFADLLKPEYKGKVALNGNPNKSGSAFAGVWAASLSQGGSLDDIGPGVQFFKKLKDVGNYNPVESTPATVEKGETPSASTGTTSTPATASSSCPRASTSRWPCRPTASTPSTTCRPSTRTPRIPPPRGCGWSSSTAPRARTCGSRAAPARC